MAKRQILIYLNHLDPAAEIAWQVLDQQMRPGPVFHGDLKTAANHASGCRVVVIIPGQEILLTGVDMPAMNRQRLNKAIPFALEETVAADLEDLHFATGVRAANGQICVAVSAREQLEYWMGILHNAGINADVLVPAVLAVPAEEVRWRVILESSPNDPSGLVMLRRQLGGISFERNNLEALLKLAIEQCPENQRPQAIEFVQLNSQVSTDAVSQDFDADSPTVIQKQEQENERLEPTLEDASKPASLSDYVNSDRTLPIGSAARASSVDYPPQLNQQLEATISPEIQTLCSEYGIALEYSSGDYSTLTYMSAQGLSQYEVNLLQGEFSRKEQLERIFRPWLPAAAVAAVWLLIQTGLLGFQYMEMSSQEKQLIQRMDRVFADAFPQAKKTKFHLREMKNRIANLQKEDVVVGGFIPLLHQTGSVLKDHKNANVKSLRYKNDKMDITMEINDLQALDALKEKLINKAQLKVEIVTANARNGKVNSRIQVEPQG